jgi:hypothetical protein
VSAALRDPKRYEGFSDVVVDITSIPRGLYFPAVGTLLELWHPAEGAPPQSNLHVVVCENPAIDRRIESEGSANPDFMFGFRGGIGTTSTAESVAVWIPVLGENKRATLEAIHREVNPTETIPILPFPSQSPRRGDEIVIEYHDLIFQSWNVDPRNMLPAAEDNPFDLYRQICRIEENYRRALNSLGGAYTVLSSHSSKLISVGALLAASERKLPVIHAEPTGYALTEGDNDGSDELFELWLAGEVYA